MTLKVGADPEVFVKDLNTNHVIPCVGKIPGNKSNPFSRKTWPDGFAVQEDNVMAEFNVPPAHNLSSFIDNVINGKEFLRGELNAVGLDIATSYYGKSKLFSKDALSSPQAQQIGCESDLDAYAGGARRDPAHYNLTNWRSAGGHIHLGGTFNCPPFVVALFTDLYMYYFVNTLIGSDNERQKWYGQPGIFRKKPYGIEYRTPSNSWLSTSGSMEKVGSTAFRVMKAMQRPATEIQKAFIEVDWARFRQLRMGNITDKDEAYAIKLNAKKGIFA